MTELIYIPVEQLKIHPRNLRLYYPDNDVQEMAASIRAAGGVIQALQVVHTGDTVTIAGEKMPAYYVVDGNMRLSAARTIDDCPPLKCEMLTSNLAEQLLVMATTSHFHYPKDAISKAKHYKRLVEEEGLTPPQIAELTGLSASSIYNAINLLESTDEAAQKMIGEGTIPADITLHRTMARIPDPAKRLELYNRIARLGFSARQAIKSARFILGQYERLAAAPVEPPPTNGRNGHGKAALPLPQVAAPLPPKTAPRQITPKSAQFSAEKVAEIAALNLCPGCRLDGLTSKCYTCPGPYEFINHLVDLLPTETREQAVGEEALVNGKSAK